MTFIDELQTQRQAAVAAAQQILSTASARTGAASPRRRAARFDACRADDRADHRPDRRARRGRRAPQCDRRQPALQRLRGGGGRAGGPGTAGQLAPLEFGDEEMRRLQAAAQRGETVPASSTATSPRPTPLLPSQLFPFPIERQHESPHPGPAARLRDGHREHHVHPAHRHDRRRSADRRGHREAGAGVQHRPDHPAGGEDRRAQRPVATRSSPTGRRSRPTAAPSCTSRSSTSRTTSCSTATAPA